MPRRVLHIHGELYLTLEEVADCYQFEVLWLQELCELDLLGECEVIDGSRAVAARMLDRIAEIRRLHLQTGMDLNAIAIVFSNR